jgi:uncharacterized DUF497 family protein
MKLFNWDLEKNEWLKENRGICFEDVVFCIENEFVLDHAKHPDQKRYKGQKIITIEFKGYAYLVPYIESDDEIFLKTIIPSRKATRDFIKRKEE